MRDPKLAHILVRDEDLEDLHYSDTNETAHLIKSPIHPNLLYSESHIDTENTSETCKRGFTLCMQDTYLTQPEAHSHDQKQWSLQSTVPVQGCACIVAYAS